MVGKRLGYIRVSSFEQNHDRQLQGIAVDRSFIDKASGKNTSRPQLTALLDYARDGDIIIVHSMDRLARNLDDLRKLVMHCTAQQINIEFIKEGLTFTGTDSPMSNLLLSVMGAFAEFERALIKERQMEGIALAKQRGAKKVYLHAFLDGRDTPPRSAKASLEKAVHQQLMTDVPYGVLLSGGLDSSIIAAIVKKYSNRRIETDNSSEAWWPKLHSFSVGLEVHQI